MDDVDQNYRWIQSLGHEVITPAIWGPGIWTTIHQILKPFEPFNVSIDKQYNERHQMWLELIQPSVHQKECAKRCFTRWRQYSASKKYERFFCNIDSFLMILPAEMWCRISKEIGKLTQSCYTPLRFYFCRSNELNVDQLLQSIKILGSWMQLNKRDRKTIKTILNHSLFDLDQLNQRLIFFVYSSIFVPLIQQTPKDVHLPLVGFFSIIQTKD